MNRDIWVVAEHFQGRLNDITFELLGKGRELARTLGMKLEVALFGHRVAQFSDKHQRPSQCCGRIPDRAP